MHYTTIGPQKVNDSIPRPLHYTTIHDIGPQKVKDL
jgi:hypothetical protein